MSNNNRYGLQTNNLLTKTISFAFVIISLSVAYYYVLFLPGIERSNRVKSQLQEQLKEAQLSERQDKIAECQTEAATGAVGTLKTKAEIGNNKALKDAAAKELYLKGDYDAYYEQCLQRNSLK